MKLLPQVAKGLLWLRSILFGKRLSPEAPSPEKEQEQPTLSHQKAEEASPEEEKETILLNIGLDFGTSFTKVCVRDIGEEETILVSLGEENIENVEEVMMRSIVRIGKDGTLSIPKDFSDLQTGERDIKYLKMRLAKRWPRPTPETSDDVQGIDINNKETIEALSAWFLAKVIVQTKEQFRKNESDRLKEKKERWMVTIGTPIKDYSLHSKEVKRTFEEVRQVAWNWAQSDDIPATLSDSLEKYAVNGAVESSQTGNDDSPYVLPEILAATRPFTFSHEAQSGMYIVCFDIGGGTLDCTAFQYLSSGERRVSFRSGDVKNLGVEILQHRNEVEKDKLDEVLATGSQEIVESEHEIRKLVGGAITKIMDGDKEGFKGYLREVNDELPIFLCGGGIAIQWYENTIASTHEKFSHGGVGISRYDIRKVNMPRDFVVEETLKDEFHRFAVSYGLSYPPESPPKIIGVPEDIEPYEPQPPKKPPFDYTDKSASAD